MKLNIFLSLYILYQSELEAALNQANAKYEEVNKKRLILETKITDFQEKHLKSAKEISIAETNLTNANNRILTLEDIRRTLECSNESLQNSVRILQVSDALIFLLIKYYIILK